MYAAKNNFYLSAYMHTYQVNTKTSDKWTIVQYNTVSICDKHGCKSHREESKWERERERERERGYVYRVRTVYNQ